MLNSDCADSPTSSPDAPAPAVDRRYAPGVLGANGADKRWKPRARLLGGAADGRSVQLDSLIDAIAVYLVDGVTIGCDRALPRGIDGRFVGVYRLASGTGPEQPVYVAAV
jgi:hypothetical protein